jgi:hypothetical protein
VDAELERINEFGTGAMPDDVWDRAQSVSAVIDHGRLITACTPAGLVAQHEADPCVRQVVRGSVTLEGVFIGVTGSEIRD